ncbi:hypothetical protein RFI_02007 [Reticulomyxa filosa]|uniref:Uncharacterized protein n=1 Tax=Reticulomyxa filosa TaxID=46433 RepID=X6PA64_RETFI|nr:hypothetical protein RFI_02007 [Reticulomyxa filosa]|eukprot:ETO35066.1 hypothetical protein RFI_02007 [Reticulomyxa filosa]
MPVSQNNPFLTAQSQVGAYFDRDLRYREIGLKYYEELQNTKEFQETQYYGIGYDKPTLSLVPLNQFWCDFAKHVLTDDTLIGVNARKAFVSQYSALPTSCLTEMVFALAVLELPLQTNGETVKRDKNFETMTMVITSEEPCIVLSKQLRETNEISIRVQVSQHYFDPEDLYEMFDGERTDKFVRPDKMTPSKRYGCRAIITNASSAQIRNVEVLYQIPMGSIPVNGGKWTHTQFETIPSYSSKIIEFYFYFPTVGEYTHFPVQISKNGQILGHCSDNSKMVVSIPTHDVQINEDNWPEVASSGDLKTVIKYLEKHNLNETDLGQMYYMLHDKTNYVAIMDLLESRHHFDNEVWRFSVIHRNIRHLAHYLQCNTTVLRHVFEPYFKSEWGFVYDDQSLGNHFTTHLEYFPLINSRSHKLGTQKKILNGDLRNTYTTYLRRMCYVSVDLKHMQWLDLMRGCYYLLLQDRISESQFLFRELIEKEQSTLKTKYAMQYDYMRAYLSLVDEKDETCEIVQQVCDKYVNAKTLPINKQRLFEDMRRQMIDMYANTNVNTNANVKEGQVDNNNAKIKSEEGKQGDIEMSTDKDKDKDKDSGDGDDTLGKRERRMERHASNEPSIDFEIENRQLVFQYSKIDSARVNFYRMDIELLFSMSPFLSRGQMDASQNVFSFIQPNASTNIKFPANHSNIPKSYTTGIPKSLLNTNMYCEVVVTSPSTYSSSNSLSQTFYDHRLLVQIKERFGQLKVLDKETKRPLQKCYVKVYARVNGCPKFHKDGYTDRGGVFDYVSVSCNHLTCTDKFAILVSSEERGAVVQTVNAPQ